MVYRILQFTVIIFAFVFGGWFLGLIGFTKLKIIDKQRLNNPIAIKSIEGDKIRLANGASVTLTDSADLEDTNYLRNVGDSVELMQSSDGEVYVFGHRQSMICGTGTTGFIIVPIFTKIEYRYRREMWGIGKLD